MEIRVRIGITFGQLIVYGENQRTGEAANLAARFESLKWEDLKPFERELQEDEFASHLTNRMLVSGEVHELLKDKYPSVRVGWLQPKDIPRLYEVFLIEWDKAAPISLPDFHAEPPQVVASAAEPLPRARALKANTSPATRFELRGLNWYEEADRDALCGRKDDVRALQRLVLEEPVVRLKGPSGVGKSSLLRAGLLPALRDLGFRAAVVRPYTDPAQRLPAELSRELLTGDSPPFTSPLDFGRLRGELAPLLEAANCRLFVLFIDQVEDLLTPGTTPEAVEALVAFLSELYRAQYLQPRIHAVVAYRTDADTKLDRLWQQVSGQPAGLPYHALEGISREQAQGLLTSTAQRRHWNLQVKPADLVNELMRESRGIEMAGEVYPPYLQILLARIIHEQPAVVDCDDVLGMIE